MANGSIQEAFITSSFSTFMTTTSTATPAMDLSVPPITSSTTLSSLALPATMTMSVVAAHVNEVLTTSRNGSGGSGGNSSAAYMPGNFSYNGEHFNFNPNGTLAQDLITDPTIQFIFCILYVTIFMLGVFGNVLVCYVVFRNRAMQTVTNLFIMNLALSDILLCFLAVPVTPAYTFLRRWIFGTALCHLMLYAQACSVYVSSLTLTSIAIDRFFVIIYPFHPRMKLTTCAAIILGIWCFAVLVTLPYGLYIDHYYALDNVTSYCEESWPSEHNRKVFGSITSTLQFVLPFLIISFCYVRVSIKLNDRARRKPGTKTSHKERLDRARKKRTNRMLIAMVAVFGISWLPLNCVNILNDFYEKSSQWTYYNILFFVAHTVAMSSTCYNPFLYAWLNENFRKEFKQVLPCFSRHQANGQRQGNGTKWRSERTCNGNNETMQESLLPSSCRPNGMTEIIPRGPTANEEDRIVFKQRLQTSSVDSILLSDVGPPKTIFNGSDGGSGGGTLNGNGVSSLLNGETIMLPSGVLETPFDGTMADMLLRRQDEPERTRRTPDFI